MSPKAPNALLHGTLDALILKTLAGGPLHGYAIARFIEEATARPSSSKRGRCTRRSTGWNGGAGSTPSGARRSSVGAPRSTGSRDEGRAQLAAETATWKRFAAGVSKVLLAR